MKRLEFSVAVDSYMGR